MNPEQAKHYYATSGCIFKTAASIAKNPAYPKRLRGEEKKGRKEVHGKSTGRIERDMDIEGKR